MGLLGPGISEVIATTRQNAAPIGIHCRKGDLSAVLFKGSHTAENVGADGWLVANVVQDPVLFVRTAFDDLPASSFVSIPALGWDRLSETDGYVACTAEVVRETPDALMVELSIVLEEVLTVRCLPFNRARSAVIEATVHATRFRQNHDPGLYHLIQHHASVVRRCGGPDELEALRLLDLHLQGWGDKKSE